jgi:DNA-binding MarR family transcriptional regulator
MLDMSKDKIDLSIAEAPLAALLLKALHTYGWVVTEALDKVGCSDMPRNGTYVVRGIANTLAVEDLIRQLGVSKQSASQLVDTLVIWGYIERTTDPDDRRRQNVTLTERGKLASDTIKSAVAKIDAELVREVGEEFVKHTKATLAVLIDINDRKYDLPAVSNGL